MHQFFLTYIFIWIYKKLTPLSGLSEQLFTRSTHNSTYPIWSGELCGLKRRYS